MTEQLTCLEARRELQTEPERPSEALRAHLESCPACARAAENAREFESWLHRAFNVPVPDGLAERLLLAQTTRTRYRFPRLGLALAAGIVLALAVGVTWQFGARPISDAGAVEKYVVDHIHHEPQAMTATGQASMDELKSLLGDYGLKLAGDLPGKLVYVKRCPTPHGTGVHFVVLTDSGPVAFYYMPNERIHGPMKVSAEDLAGYIESFHSGSVALVSRRGEDMDAAARQLVRAVVSSGG